MKGYYIRNIEGGWYVYDQKGKVVAGPLDRTMAENRAFRLNFEKDPPPPVANFAGGLKGAS